MSVFKKAFLYLIALLFCLLLPGIIPDNHMILFSAVLSMFLFLGLTYTVLRDGSKEEKVQD